MRRTRTVPSFRAVRHQEPGHGRSWTVIVRVKSRHMDVTPAIKSFAEQKASKLTKYFDRISEIEVVVDAGIEKSTREQSKVEIIVHVEHSNSLVAHHEGADAYASIDACVEKLERQLTDHKERLRNRKHPDGDAKRNAPATGDIGI